jgi:hypothetical protein
MDDIKEVYRYSKDFNILFVISAFASSSSSSFLFIA